MRWLGSMSDEEQQELVERVNRLEAEIVTTRTYANVTDEPIEQRLRRMIERGDRWDDTLGQPRIDGVSVDMLVAAADRIAELGADVERARFHATERRMWLERAQARMAGLEVENVRLKKAMDIAISRPISARVVLRAALDEINKTANLKEDE
jgi:hypothetical protein